jgi:DNA recombination protein RmuC
MLNFDVAIIALLAGGLIGILIGFLGRNSLAKKERANLEHSKEQLSTALNSAGAELKQVRKESDERAGYQSLAEERLKTIEQNNAEKSELRDQLRAKAETESAAQARISELETELRKERESMAEKVALLDTAEKTLSDKFEALSGKIFDEKAKAFSETNKSEMGNLLSPLREQLGDFRKKVEEAQSDSKTGVTELKTLIGTLGNLNQALTEEAHNLATALRRDTKAQGNWGETILRNILDKSGLQEGVHYSFQQSFLELDGDGEPVQRRQTDVVVKLPGGRHLVIDSKVSLNDYNDSVNAENEKDREEAVKRHVASVRKHFNELAGRNYHSLDGIDSPDFVVMFVPIEPAFLTALQNDETLWQNAYAKGVLLSGPTTVLFVIRIVEDLWRQEKQAQSVDKVMKRGAELYDKFAGFVGNLEQVGKALLNARKAYDQAHRQLASGPGNLVRQVEMLRELGVTPRSKNQISARMLNQSELDQSELDRSELDRSELGRSELGQPEIDQREIEEPSFALAAEGEESGAAE